jgi:hypothetical protein
MYMIGHYYIGQQEGSRIIGCHGNAVNQANVILILPAQDSVRTCGQTDMINFLHIFLVSINWRFAKSKMVSGQIIPAGIEDYVWNGNIYKKEQDLLLKKKNVTKIRIQGREYHAKIYFKQLKINFNVFILVVLYSPPPMRYICRI